MDWIARWAVALGGMLVTVSVVANEPYHGVVLQYHHVDDGTPHVTSTRPKDFQDHLDYIDSNGFTLWSLPRLITALQQGEAVPDRVVAITFDDAYVSIYERAFPELKKRNWPFTVFVSTDFVDSGARRALSWQQLREMVAAGAVVGNHTRSHLHIPQLLEAEDDSQRLQRVRDEVTGAQHRIDAEVGVQPKIFAYPYGEVDPAAQALIEELGYVAFGQQSGAIGNRSDFGFLPRFPASGAYAEIKDLSVKLWSLPLPVIQETPSSMVLPEGETRPELELLLAPGPYRARQIACFASGQGRMPITIDSVTIDGEERVRVQSRAEQGVAPGRSRYNCTAPDARGKRYYWYSKPWLRAGYWD
ncbi:polysaccharide deacetylase family protein [Aestuariirhabdus sp. LZHN29]|uniref:polysaccharide deacetylase family protein n=1 Tax=Aestuariirhabdus sp. LZHN29 TaxID=3417462 RepID=UPI003CF23BD7